MENIKSRIEKLEQEMFYLEMKDHWSREDFEQMSEWRNELRQLKAELEK